MTRRFIQPAAILATAGIALAAGSCGESTAPDLSCPDLPTAPASARVDLGQPSFSNPTNVTNPLFPISQLARVLLLGSVDGLPLRVETTLLPYTRTIELDGTEVETLVSQYVAFLDGRILEVALDWYGQADDGSVWYFGEDVFNYEAGVVVDTDGTWLAGRDGPAAMIMAANPQVGNVWRPENICGFVFEEVTVTAAGVTVNGPRGPVNGAIVVEELHMDTTREDKIFAPGYGEFSTGSGGDLEAVALAVPTDALPGPTPVELETLSSRATSVFDAAQTGDWSAASAAVNDMTAAWAAFQAGGVPPMLDTQMDGALTALEAAVIATQPAAARQAAIDVARASLDLQLRHRPRAEIDVALIDLWVRQIIVDAEADDLAGVLGDIATLKWIRDRIAQDVPYEPDLKLVDARLGDIRAAARARDLPAAAAAAARLRETLAGLP